MDMIIAIQEENNIHSWLPSPNEQYQQPPEGALTWVHGATDEELLQQANWKCSRWGFVIVGSTFYPLKSGGRAIHVIIKERTDGVTSLQFGDHALNRSDVTKAILH